MWYITIVGMRYGITVYSLVFTYTKYNLELGNVVYYHSRDEVWYNCVFLSVHIY